MVHENKLKEILERVLKINKENLNDESSPDNIASWDSFNGLMLISEIEKTFNVKFTMQEVMMIKNVADIKYILTKHEVDL
jgi:acyl carrier protein